MLKRGIPRNSLRHLLGEFRFALFQRVIIYTFIFRTLV